MGRILFICQGNICRSPFAERYAVAQALRLGGQIAVESAGFDAMDGYPMHPQLIPELEARGGSARGFRARSLESPMLDDADLILTMTLRQRHMVRSGWPHWQDRTHTLGLAGRVAPEIGRTLGPAQLAEVLVERLDKLSADDDVPDPMLRGPVVAAEVAGLIAARVDAVLDCVL